MIVKAIASKEAHPFILHRHYAKRIPQIVWAFGLFVDDNLHGVVTYGRPASPAPCRGVCGASNAKYVWELNRLAINEPAPLNAASFLIGRSLQLLAKNGPAIILSWADTSYGHVGYVYQSTNFLYTGSNKPRTDPFMNGAHPRHQTNVDFTQRQPRAVKHRYVKFIGNRRNQRLFYLSFAWTQYAYPKGDTARTDGENV